MADYNKNLSIDYKLLINLMAELFVVLDGRGRIIQINKRAQDLLGYDDEEVLKLNWFEDCLPKGIRSQVKKLFIEIIGGRLEGAEFYENPLVTKAGKERIISWHNTIMKNERGEVFSISLGRDVTESRDRRRQLEESETHYRILAENVMDLIISLDMKLNLTYISPAIGRLTGYTAEEARKIGLTKLLTPKSLLQVGKVFTQDLLLEKAAGSDPDRARLLELELKRKDGRIIPIESKTKFLRDSAGKAIGVVGVVRDISERLEMRKKLEDSLVNSEKQELILKTVVDNSPLGIFIFDAGGRIEYANSAMMTISGTTKEKLIEQNLLDHAGYKAIGLDKFIHDLVKNGKEFKTGIIKYRSVLGGKETYRIFHGFPLLDSTGKINKAFLTIEDVTSLKKINEDLEKLNRLMVDRELKMVELKKRLGEEPSGQ